MKVTMKLYDGEAERWQKEGLIQYDEDKDEWKVTDEIFPSKSQNYYINVKTGIAIFRLYEKDNVANLMLLYLATHDFTPPERNNI